MTGVSDEPEIDLAAHEATVHEVAAGDPEAFCARREELARIALAGLAELGYARASRRAIAEQCHIPYAEMCRYFADTIDLMKHCVSVFKSRCAHRYDEVIAYATGPRDFESGFAAAMAVTLRDEAGMHRLWYDLRCQSMFERSFSATVDDIDLSLQQMIWRAVTRYATLRGTAPVVPPAMGYALFDGLFQQALLRYLDGDEGAPEALACDVADLLVLVVPA
ncbi:TetR/AcrR family transcriptional regulator [Tsukamurella soli]|uniref:TetR/AcrR family transcriptional regulator n=1 Tax=Tsukamurella soli TaxID=644556 RepID=A0ABP8JII6_9ACTN